jgi:NADH-quinone oxidoreductase subunit H
MNIINIKMMILTDILIILIFLINVANLTLLERKILSKIQRRVGPNYIGGYGALQPFLDGVKLMIKESIIPYNANKMIYIFSPFLTMGLSLSFLSVIPLDENYVISNIKLSLLFVFFISGLGVYGIIFAGWSSNSKYSFLGGVRSAAQMISYEVCIGIILLSVIFCTQSYNFYDIINFQKNIWLIGGLISVFFMHMFSILAETNRTPFDLPEAEAELVSGYNTEYGSMGFALFFIGEYGNVIIMSFITVILFLGGYYIFGVISVLCYILKLDFMLCLFIILRGVLPRYRYDQLMRLGWKIFLPSSLGVLFLNITLLLMSLGIVNYMGIKFEENCVTNYILVPLLYIKDIIDIDIVIILGGDTLIKLLLIG